MSRRFVATAALAIIIGLAASASGCALSWRDPIQAQLPEEIAQEALAVALTRIGCPYDWGGQGPDRFDCSGLIIWAYAQAYPDLKLRDSNVMVEDATMDVLWRWNVRRVLPDEMRPGDIVFITNTPEQVTHGGLFIRWCDSDKSEFVFINASSHNPPGHESGGAVVVDTWPVEGTKRDQWLVGAGRLLRSY